MALWFLRGIRRGVVTTRYPAGYPAPPADAWTRTLNGPPLFRPQRLTEEIADALVEICPSQALKRDGGELVYDVGACTCCGRCVGPARDAIVPSHQQELATTDRAHLIKRIPILRGRQ